MIIRKNSSQKPELQPSVVYSRGNAQNVSSSLQQLPLKTVPFGHATNVFLLTSNIFSYCVSFHMIYQFSQISVISFTYVLCLVPGFPKRYQFVTLQTINSIIISHRTFCKKTPLFIFYKNWT